MDPAAAKLIGAGLASIALVGAGIGIGTIFGNYLAGALRNPSGGARSVRQSASRLLRWRKRPACSAWLLRSSSCSSFKNRHFAQDRHNDAGHSSERLF